MHAGRSYRNVNLFRSTSHLLAGVFNDRSHFEHAWKEYQAIANQPPTFAGPWQGEWVSAVNGHHGDLRCLLTEVGAGQLEASFCATYSGFLRVAYHVGLKAEKTDGGYRLQGQTDLGTLAGGVYSYEGELTQAAFECAYRCKYDHGAFHLKPFASAK